MMKKKIKRRVRTMHKRLTKALSLIMAAAIAFSSVQTYMTSDVYAKKSEKSTEKTSETPVIEVQYETGTQNDAKERNDDKEDTRNENDGSYEVVIPGKDVSVNDKGEIIVDGEVFNEGDEAVAWEDIHIATAEDFVELAKKCKLDTYSTNKRVYLDEDIELTGAELRSIPTFGGQFFGQGHTISGYTMTDARSYTGLFAYVQEHGVIDNLNVRGSVKTEGGQYITGGIAGENRGEIRNCTFQGGISGEKYVGAICGYNELTGIIINCRSKGMITGSYYTGGIAGENVGNISSCINEAKINTTNIDKTTSIQDFSLSDYTSGILGKITGQTESKEAKKPVVEAGSIDTGGIAGVSIGVIQFCDNKGEIGYEHVGYNIGGIVGRQSGYVHGCNNYGIVYGRKDVGGIVGQAEPYVVVNLTEDTITKLSDGINNLHDIIENTLSHAGDSTDTISDRLEIVKEFTDKALKETTFLSNETIDFTNGVIDAGNDLSSRVQYILDESSEKNGPIDHTEDAMGELRDAAHDFEKAMNDANIEKYMTQDESRTYTKAKERIDYLTKRQSVNSARVTNADRNRLMRKYSQDTTKPYNAKANDLLPYKMVDGVETALSAAEIGTVEGAKSKTPDAFDQAELELLESITVWKHQDADTTVHTDKCSICYDAEATNNLSSDVANELATEAEAKKIDKKADDITKNEYDTEYSSDWHTGNEIAKDPDEEIVLWTKDVIKIYDTHKLEMSGDAAKDGDRAAANLEKAAKNLEKAGSQTKGIVKHVADKGQVCMPKLSEAYKTSTNALNAALQGMSDNMGALNDEMSDSSHVMIDDMGDVNDQFTEIMQLYTDAMDGILDGDYGDNVEDASMEVAETCVDATIAECVNESRIEGDLDVSGIAGAMGVEYDFDLEGDITKSEDSRLTSSYQSKCVLRNNRNNARVIAQKNCVGGICGLQEIGTILRCENYGKIKSNSSDYVGGIAGSSLSYIQKSVSKCFLSGKNYIGGITGRGYNVLNCYAMVDVDPEEADSFYGAIAGDISEEGKLHYNYFVNDHLAGIDRVSFKGKAEPIDYETFISMETTPAECRKIYAVFYVDDDEADRIETIYGGSITADQFPKLFKEDGTYCDWDKEDLTDMYFDVEVEGEYKRYITSLASDQLRTNGQSIVLVDGKFIDGQELNCEILSADSVPLENAIERIAISYPSDSNLKHLVRYQNPESVDTDTDIYINNAGKWEKVDTSKFGEYKTFEVAGPHAEFAVVKLKKNYTKQIIICVVAALVLILLAAFITSKIKKRKKNKAEKDAVKQGDSQSTDDGIEIINMDDEKKE